MTAPLIYLIAGEPSGDRLGAALIAGLRTEAPDVRIAGIGGREMQAAGLEPLFDIAELSVMGITEVLPRLPAILRLMRRATEDVLARQPAALVTIDAPSFGLRVAQRVRARDPGIRTVHYVAPSVWAWRPGRARQMAAYVDQVLALLPFEPPYMEAAGMRCDFVGHPVAGRAPVPEADASAWRAAQGIDAGTPLLMLAPGSRRGEVRRLWPVFADAARRLAAARPGLALAVPVAETVEREVTGAVAALGLPAAVVAPEAGEAAKRVAMAASDAAIVASGTVTLEMAAAGTPHVSCYRTSWLTAAMVRRLVRVDTAHLVNLTIGRRAVPELFQEACTGKAVAAEAAPLLSGAEAAGAQRIAFAETLAALGAGGPDPGLRAARAVLDGLG